jgi:hypothetical protein
VNGQPTLACGEERRREKVRTADLNGLDYLEVRGDGRTLRVYFLGKVSQEITDKLEENKRHVRIEGGRRVRGLEVHRIEVERREEPDLDDYMDVVVDRKGDFSPYELRMVELEDGRPADKPMVGFDPRYAGVGFSFKAGSTSSLDCKVQEVCPPQQYTEPEIDYLAKDYASFRRLILDRLALIMPTWREQHVPDVGIALVELLAYIGDHLSYYQDAVATEAYLGTARQRVSVRRHARLVDYHLHEGCNARAWVCVETSQYLLPLDADNLAFLALKRRRLRRRDQIFTMEDLREIPSSQYERFEPLLAERVALRQRDLLDPTELVSRLRNPAEEDSLSRYLAGQLSEELRGRLEGSSSDTGPDASLQKNLVEELNHLMWTDILYGAQRFPEERFDWGGGVEGPEQEIRALLTGRPRGQGPIRRLNRRALEEAYPEVIARSGWIYLREAHNEISFYTWGERECCLPRGATTATLRDSWVAEPEPWRPNQAERYPPYQQRRHRPEPYYQKPASDKPARELWMQEGDVLIFEEVKGPRTGKKADADSSRRHAVRLTRAEPGEDPLYREQVSGFPDDLPTPIVEIEWEEEDALPFALCLSTIGPAPECTLLEDISVARANVILVDHGTTGDPELLDQVPGSATPVWCGGEDLLQINADGSDRFRPYLKKAPLTFSQPLSPGVPASRMLGQKPRLAMPQIKRLAGTRAAGSDTEGTGWTVRPDLVGSGGEDRHFMVEVDNRGRAWLRFGDGDLGRAPEPGMRFHATYRVGNGPVGNVGAEAISHVLLRNNVVSGASLKPRNPLPAQAGTAPETLDEAKMFAPHASQSELLRAVTAEDYGHIASNYPGVHRAVATLRWTGSWHEVVVAVDPLGEVQASKQLLREIEEHLLPYRRMGHDLKVAAAEYVPLDLELQVGVLPTFLRGHVKASLLDLFSNRVLPDGRRGFFHPDNLSFGDDVHLSKIVAAAQDVAGVEGVAVTKLERLYEGPNQEIETGVLSLDPLEIARLDNDPSQPENGRLRLKIGVGR